MIANHIHHDNEVIWTFQTGILEGIFHLSFRKQFYILKTKNTHGHNMKPNIFSHLYEVS